MTQLMRSIQTALWNITHRLDVLDVVDILIVSVIIYEVVILIRNTRGSAVLKGVVLLLFVTGVSTFLGLTALNWLMMSILSNGTVVLIVLFQPELRTALEQLGRGAVLESQRQAKTENPGRIVDELVQCCLRLSKRRVGALIVFERKVGLKDVMETGTRIDGRISAPLLENIFEPNTPLHDGAVIISGEHVVAAACILTLTESRSVSRDLGTRHRAAIGISEITDCLSLIVSEETGIISVAEGGNIRRPLDEAALREVLGSLYGQNNKRLTSFTRKKVRKEAAK